MSTYHPKVVWVDVGVRKVRVTLMIEAVNSTVANATTVRGVVGQVDSASIASVATVLPASGSNAAPSAPQAPFVSPFISVDLNFNRPVLQIRDAQTGDVKQQFPTESRLAQIATMQAQLRGAIPEHSSVQVVQTTPTPSGGGSVAQTSQVAVQTVDVTTVQDVTSTPASNTASSTPQVAVAALSAAAQSSAASAVSAPESSGVTVYA